MNGAYLPWMVDSYICGMGVVSHVIGLVSNCCPVLFSVAKLGWNVEGHHAAIGSRQPSNNMRVLLIIMNPGIFRDKKFKERILTEYH